MKVVVRDSRKELHVTSLSFGEHFVRKNGDNTVYQLTDGKTASKDYLLAVNITNGKTTIHHMLDLVVKVVPEQDVLRFRYE